LNEAAGKGHVNAVETLIKHGANIEQGNKYNATPLFIGNFLN
jgi:ankyrin repeat protein